MKFKLLLVITSVFIATMQQVARGETQFEIEGTAKEFKRQGEIADRKNDLAKAFELFLKAAEKDDAEAQFNVATMYEKGDGTKKDLSKALYWYKKAASARYAPAMNNLGTLYNAGRGVAQDYSKAVFWYKKAAQAGNKTAMYNLAMKFWYGQGTEKNPVMAYAWLTAAAKRNDFPAMAQLFRIGEQLTPAQIEQARYVKLNIHLSNN